MIKPTPKNNPGPAEPHALRILLADSSPAARRELRAELDRLRLVDIVGEASKGPDAMDLFLRHRPELVVVAVSLPDEGGFNVLRSIKRAQPDCVVILTTLWPEPFVEKIGSLLGATAVCSMIRGPTQISEIAQDLLSSRQQKSTPSGET